MNLDPNCDPLANLPEELDFHVAGDERDTLVELKSDESELYGQLVCWCLIQRFWYYVLGTPQVPDTYYDMIELALFELEDIYPSYLSHPYSPRRIPGSDNPYDYPSSIRTTFFCEERLGCSIQQYRLQNKK